MVLRIWPVLMLMACLWLGGADVYAASFDCGGSAAWRECLCGTIEPRLPFLLDEAGLKSPAGVDAAGGKENVNPDPLDPTRTPDPIIGVLLQGRCHMDYCSWFSIEKKMLVGKNSQDALYQVVTKGWESHHPNASYDKRTARTGGKVSTRYVLCSHRRPAVILSDGGKWLVHTLAPGNEDGIFGFNESDYKEYFAVCHRLRIDDVYSDGVEAGRKLRYNVDPESVDQSEISDPRDMLRR
jgi:hypothetical protein